MKMLGNPAFFTTTGFNCGITVVYSVFAEVSVALVAGLGLQIVSEPRFSPHQQKNVSGVGNENGRRTPPFCRYNGNYFIL